LKAGAGQRSAVLADGLDHGLDDDVVDLGEHESAAGREDGSTQTDGTRYRILTGF
jgi:hypothetical protein